MYDPCASCSHNKGHLVNISHSETFAQDLDNDDLLALYHFSQEFKEWVERHHPDWVEKYLVTQSK